VCGSGGLLCQSRRPSNAPGATSARERRHPRRQENSFAKRFITFAKASTAHVPPSRRLPSACRRRGAQASSCRRLLVAPRRPPNAAPLPQARPAGNGRARLHGARVRCAARYSAKAAAPRRARHWHVRQGRQHGNARPRAGAPRHAARPEPKARESVEPLRKRQPGPGAAGRPRSGVFAGDQLMIRKLKSGEYRLYSRKKDPKTGRRRNLGTFGSRAAAEKHERAVQFFKRH